MDPITLTSLIVGVITAISVIVLGVMKLIKNVSCCCCSLNTKDDETRSDEVNNQESKKDDK